MVDLKVSRFMGTLADPLDPEAINEPSRSSISPSPDPGDPFYVPFGTGDSGGAGSEPLF